MSSDKKQNHDDVGLQLASFANYQTSIKLLFSRYFLSFVQNKQVFTHTIFYVFWTLKVF